jgi:hypothetical protein
MKDIIKTIQEKFDSENDEQYIEGLDIACKAIESITALCLSLYQKKIDKFILTEKLYNFFDYYLSKLCKLNESSDNNVSFWAACLLVSHSIENLIAVNKLLYEIENGEIEKAQIATTILAKKRNPFLIQSIQKRLKRNEKLDNNDILFFNEKINELSNKKG